MPSPTLRPPFAPVLATLLVALALSFQPRVCRAQCEEGWLEGKGVPGVNGLVYASVAWDPDGAGPQPPWLVVAGRFTRAGNVAAANVAAWDGAAWRPMGDGLEYDAYALCVHNAQLHVGGGFQRSGQTLLRGVARWDGSAWRPVGDPDNPGPGTTVYALASHNAELCAAGQFTGAVARFDGAAWVPLVTGFVSTPRALLSFAGELIVGGEFDAINGLPNTRAIARWNAVNGWRPVGAGIYSGTVTCLGVHGAQLHAGGFFALTSNFTLQHIARWDAATGGPNGTLNSIGANAPSTVNCILSHNGLLYLGAAQSLTQRRLLRWNGGSFQTVGTGCDSEVNAMTLYNARIAVAGAFVDAGGVAAERVALVDPATSQFAALGEGLTGPPGSPAVYALEEFNGSLVCAGGFRVGGTTAGTTGSPNVARFDGAALQPMGAGFNDVVRALEVHNAELYAAGDFSSSGAAAASRVARWNGSAWVGVGGGVNFRVYALASWNGTLVVAGDFSSAGGTSGFGRIARWNGSAWQTFGTGMNSYVYALAVHNGDLYAGGAFSQAGTANVAGLARWDGAAWQPVGTPAGPGASVQALLSHNGSLYAAGSFNPFSGALHRVARFDGTSWQPLASGLNNGVEALAVHDARVVAGGRFSADYDQLATLNAVARFDGAAWRPMGSGLTGSGGFAGGVSALASFQGRLYAGGTFGLAGGRPSTLLARWGCLPCRADFNGVGGVELLDIFAFLQSWFNGCTGPGPSCVNSADFDGLNGVDLTDIFGFLQAWFNGCP